MWNSFDTRVLNHVKYKQRPILWREQLSRTIQSSHIYDSVIIECHTTLLLACNLACNSIESVTYLMMHVNYAFRKRAQPLSFRICFNKTIRSSHAPNLVSRLRSWSQKFEVGDICFIPLSLAPKKTGRLLIDVTSIHACWQLHVRLICLKSFKLQFHC